MGAIAEHFKGFIPKRDANDETTYNPIAIFRMMTPLAWAMYFSGWFAWTMDAWDFFSVSLTAPLLAEQFGFGSNVTKITTSITLTLLFRSLGAVVFGLAADRYGRKWTLVANLVLVAVLQLGSGFVETFPQFLAVRSLFGIGMGGIWGQSAATALENVPVAARGLLSGILQQGYAAGYLFAACADLYLVPVNPHSWRVLFWIGSGLSLLAAIVRALLPESAMFLEAKAAEKANPTQLTGGQKSKAFMRELGIMLKANWLRCIHAVLLMTGFNFLSHGSQDLYPTYLKTTKGLSPLLATKATIIGNCGAIAGGTIAGYVSQYLGRRLTIIICVIWLACFIPLWIIPAKFGPLSAGAFFVQMGVQGAWGVIPIFLNEISPPAFRGTFPGVAYQLGNMVSSAAAQIEATAGEHLTTVLRGKTVPDYAKIQGILIGVVSAWVILMTLIASENHGAHFEQARVAFEEGAGVGLEREDQIAGAKDVYGEEDKTGGIKHKEDMA